MHRMHLRMKICSDIGIKQQGLPDHMYIFTVQYKKHTPATSNRIPVSITGLHPKSTSFAKHISVSFPSTLGLMISWIFFDKITGVCVSKILDHPLSREKNSLLHLPLLLFLKLFQVK